MESLLLEMSTEWLLIAVITQLLTYFYNALILRILLSGSQAELLLVAHPHWLYAVQANSKLSALASNQIRNRSEATFYLKKVDPMWIHGGYTLDPL